MICFYRQPREINAILNEYADKIFENVQRFIIHSGLDPAEAPDMHTGFSYVGSIFMQNIQEKVIVCSVETFARRVKSKLYILSIKWHQRDGVYKILSQSDHK